MDKPYYRNDGHEFLTRRLVSRGDADNRAFAGACYLLAATGKQEVADYVGDTVIDVKGLLAASERWSSTEKGLVRVAINIYAQMCRTPYEPADIPRLLNYSTTRGLR